MLNLTRPKYFIPIHGELRHLKQHAHIAEQIGIPRENILVIENGQSVIFNKGEMKLGHKVAAPYVFVDGSGVGDIDPQVMREREMLAQDGVVIIHLRINRSNGRLQEDPQIVTKGFIPVRSIEGLSKELKHKITEALHQSNGDAKKKIETVVGNYLYSETRRRPMVFVMMEKG